MNGAVPMRVPDPGFDPDGFFAALADAPARALVLDYDGTLAPFHVDPARARPYPEVMQLVAEIMAAGRTRVVVASGRWTRDLIPLLGLPERPELWGSHGRERLLPDGTYTMAPIAPALLEQLSRADDWCEALTAFGARIERKPASVAVHWRGLPAADVGRIRDELLARWRLAGAGEGGITLHDFDGGVELRDRSLHKGLVIRTLVAELGVGGVLAYLGDDLTDEDAFREVPASGLAVLVRSEPRPTLARLRLRPPGELREFLARWLKIDRR